jgi:cytochrome c553
VASQHYSPLPNGQNVTKNNHFQIDLSQLRARHIRDILNSFNLLITPEKTMNKKIVVLLTSGLLFLSANTMAAGDAAAGKAKSMVCAACHGADGTSPADIWPNLKGQKNGYLVKQLKAFKDGSRKDPSMAGMVAGLSDEDIDNLAAYYSSL